MTPRTTLLSTVLIAATTTLFAQQASPTSADPTTFEIQIDQYCRVLTPSKPTVAHPNPQPRFRYNNVVCHIESRHISDRWEQGPNGKEVYARIAEREYVLQDVTGQPVTFVITHTLPKGWHVDSDPQPTEVNGTTAIFRVVAQPGQVVRLHVGQHS